jgi:hypothetical protein
MKTPKVMRKLMGLLAVLLLPFLPATAEDAPKADLYLGYSLVRAPLGPVLPNPVTIGGVNLYGGSGSIAYNVTRALGIFADVGVYNVSGGPSGNGNLSSYLFGPRLSYRGDRRFRPYLHFLVGGLHTAPQVFGVASAQSSFAYGAGGGVDIKLFHGIAFRLGQADVIHASFRIGAATATRGQNNLRVSTGVVFSFGK